jgi:hypothetical protein
MGVKLIGTTIALVAPTVAFGSLKLVALVITGSPYNICLTQCTSWTRSPTRTPYCCQARHGRSTHSRVRFS